MTVLLDVPEMDGVQAGDDGLIRMNGGVMREHNAGHKGRYRAVTIGGVSHFVHRLVAMAFHANPDSLPCVMHGDDDPTNNRPDNLQWGTRADNNRDRAAKGRTRNQHMGKTLCKHGHLLSGENVWLRTVNGREWRVCLACKKAARVKTS